MENLINLIQKQNTSDKTKQTYINLLKRIQSSSPDFKIPITEKIDLDKVKSMLDKQSNINTKLQFLNVLVVIRNELNLNSDKLKEYRTKLQAERADHQIEKMDKLGDNIMDYDDFKKELDLVAESDDHIKYIVNFLFFNYGIRNNDLDITITDKIAEYKQEGGNYIFVGKSKLVEPFTYKRGNYKTIATYGVKEQKINDERFQEAVANLPMGKIFYNAQVNNGIRKYLIGNMTEGKIFKMLIKHFIEVNNPNMIRYLSDTRGTDIKTIREYYNMAIKKNPLDVAQLSSKEGVPSPSDGGFKGGSPLPEEEKKIIIKIKKRKNKKQGDV